MFILALFTACFYHFLFWRYLNSSMTRFSSGILLPFPNLIDLKNHEGIHLILSSPEKKVGIYLWAPICTKRVIMDHTHIGFAFFGRNKKSRSSAFRNFLFLSKYRMLWLNYKSFSVLSDVFCQKSVIYS